MNACVQHAEVFLICTSMACVCLRIICIDYQPLKTNLVLGRWEEPTVLFLMSWSTVYNLTFFSSILFLVSETATKCTEDHQREAYQGYLVSPNMDRQTAWKHWVWLVLTSRNRNLNMKAWTIFKRLLVVSTERLCS